MNIVGYSSIKQLGSVQITLGVTGATGPIGITGLNGLGLTGNTGPNIIGITLINKYLVTAFSDGTTYSTSTTIYGPTGGYDYVVDFKNIGSGVSLGYSITGTNELLIRPLRIQNNTSNNLIISTSPNDITVNLSLIGGSGVTLIANSNFTDANLLKFTDGKLRRVGATRGVTSGTNTFYGLEFVNSNLFERVRGMGWTGTTSAVNCVITNVGITCDVNPFREEYDGLMYGSTSKIFVGDFNGYTGSINIAACPSDGNAYGFEMYLSNAFNPAVLTNRFTSSSPIKWPLNKVPCFAVDGVTCDMRVSFFGLQGIWYATAKSINDSKCQNGDMFFNNCNSTQQLVANFIPVIGACCYADGTCVQTTASNCFGYFHGIGTTCGNTYDSICNKPGACCVQLLQDLGTNCFEMTCSECIGISLASYAGNYTKCKDTVCDNINNNVGACCDGLGNCNETSQNDCTQQYGFFQGIGTSCYDFKTNLAICSTGTGPCCINGVCTSQNGTNCLSQNGYFLGTGRDCSEFECPEKVSCIGYINGVPVTPGQEYGGGIIIGKFEPGKTKILGAKQLFEPTSIKNIDGTTIFNCQSYTSFLDHTAYGITKDCDFNNETYALIIYPTDINVNDTNSFAWGITGSSWGPMSDAGGNYSDFVLNLNVNDPNSVPLYYSNTHLIYNEGYWSTGVTLGLTGIDSNIILKTFPTCSASTIYGIGGKQRIFAKSPYSLHGLWHHSWGLYNTIRAISAYNAYTKKISLSNVFKYTDFDYSVDLNAFRASRLIQDGMTSSIQGITKNSGSLSGWYLPSHDELAFIAASTSNLNGFNINTHLMLVSGGQGLNGTYWSSTGTFDYQTNEGVYANNQKPKPGSVAIAFELDINGNNYKVLKAKRTEKYKVRPVRMLRCDAKTPENKYLWLLPSVSQSKINQKNIDTINIEAV